VSEPSINPSRKARGLKLLIVIPITLAVLLILIREIAGTGELVTAFGNVRWALLPASLIALLANVIVAAQRWTIILGALGYRVTMRRALQAMLATWPLSLLAPSRASDVLRAVAIRDLCPTWVGAGTVLMEKAIDVQILCLLTVVGASLCDLGALRASALGVAASEWAVLGMLYFRGEELQRMPLLRRRPELVQQLLQALRGLLRRPSRLLLTLSSSLVSWVCATLVLQTLLEATRSSVGFARALALWPTAVLAGQLPLTLAGMGTRDAAFLALLQASGAAPVSPGPVLAATLAYSLVVTWLPALVGIPFALAYAFRGAPEPCAESAVFEEARFKA
jgi:glycosyltransferase 2 family protein